MAESKVDTTFNYKTQSLTVFVIGASGDLAKKKTYPSLFALFRDGYLPEHAVVCGYARSKMELDAFHAKLKPWLLKHGKEEIVDRFLKICIYRDGAYDSAERVKTVFDELGDMEGKQECPENTVHNRLFYFAIPPTVFVPIGTALKASGMTTLGWNRLIIEKPFGRDLESFQELTGAMSALYTEDEIYRIDHYLGKEMVQNLMILRFGNIMFEPLFNRNYVKCVVITFKEDIGTMGRGGYFDNFGIIRDVMQNHLLQCLSLLAMEAPSKVAGKGAGNYVRDEKVKVLQAIEPLKLEECVMGQYVRKSDGTGEEGYLEDAGVPNDSVTPTFATCVFHINNPRWQGVPFIMKAGKALDQRKAEMRIQFNKAAGSENMFQTAAIPHNELVLRLQPTEAVYMKIGVKKPGLATKPIASELDLSYNTRFEKGDTIPDAYTRLILDVLRGQQAAFVRDDELEAAWKIFTPLLKEIEEKKPKPLSYEFGSRGPKESDELIAKLGFEYHKGSYAWKDPSPARM